MRLTPPMARRENAQVDANLASELTASGVTIQAVETVISVLAARREGASINAAAKASGINYRTAQRIVEGGRAPAATARGGQLSGPRTGRPHADLAVDAESDSALSRRNGGASSQTVLRPLRPGHRDRPSIRRRSPTCGRAFLHTSAMTARSALSESSSCVDTQRYLRLS